LVQLASGFGAAAPAGALMAGVLPVPAAVKNPALQTMPLRPS